MSQVAKLRAATSVNELAGILGFKPSALSYILYKLPESAKYSSFEIPKRSGGMRLIESPDPRLKSLQRRLAAIFSEILESIEHGGQSPSHGFRPHRSILTNATLHRGQRFVMNVDLESFFSTIHFGRVLGFLTKSNHFGLKPEVALAIAKLVCHNGRLPQGAPTSPVMSNLIARMLDLQLSKLAARNKLRYSRYADDLTFSTNLFEFPENIAIQQEDKSWTHGESLQEVIESCGFTLNTKKTRVQFRASRQDVTGLVVNDVLAVSTEYREWARVAVNHLVRHDFYFERRPPSFIGPLKKDKPKGSIEKLHGILSFIYSTHQFKRDKDTRKPPKEVQLHSDELVFQRFLYYTQFYRSDRPLLICEGKTDNVYIRRAISVDPVNFPALITAGTEADRLKIRFFPHPKHAGRLLELNSGTGGLTTFAAKYSNAVKKFSHIGPQQPVIIVVDADAAGRSVQGWAKKQPNAVVEKAFTFVQPNIYVVILKNPSGLDMEIEDLFPQRLLDKKLGCKIFDRRTTADNAHSYGKAYFAKFVVPNALPSDFSGFKPLLEDMSSAIVDFSTRKSA